MTATGLNASATISGWENYPEGVPGLKTFDCDIAGVRRRFDDAASAIFSDSEVSVDVVNAETSTFLKASTASGFSETDVLRLLDGTQPDVRIISILRKHSLSPLMVSKNLFLKILKLHDVGPCILDLAQSCKPAESLSEKGQALWSCMRTYESFEVCYSLKYMEKNDHAQGRKWSERQVGVYHRFGPSLKEVMMLFHANLSTVAHSRLKTVFDNGEYQRASQTSSLALHTLILSSYVDNWRQFLEEFGEWCLRKEDEAWGVGLNNPTVSFRQIQELRDRQAQVSVASAILQATLKIVDSLQQIGLQLARLNGGAVVTQNGSHSPGQICPVAMPTRELRCLQGLRLRLDGYKETADFLQQRIDMVISLLSDARNQRSQKTANSIADSSYVLTQQSLRDSYIVKVVTLITVIYLPMQGCATFFGMNFTAFSATTNKLAFARNWWLFLATSIPLTLITLGGLFIAWRLEKVKAMEKGNDPLSRRNEP